MLISNTSMHTWFDSQLDQKNLGRSLIPISTLDSKPHSSRGLWYFELDNLDKSPRTEIEEK